jgi:hypothetical protein
MEEIIRELIEKHDFTSVDLSYYLSALLAIAFRYMYLLNLKSGTSNPEISISSYSEYLTRVQQGELTATEMQTLSDLHKKLVDLPRLLPQSNKGWLELAEEVLRNLCTDTNIEIVAYSLLPLGLFVVNNLHKDIFELIWHDSFLSRVQWPSVKFTPVMAGGGLIDILKLTRIVSRRRTAYRNTGPAVRVLNDNNNNTQPTDLIVRERVVPQLGRDLLGIHVDTQLLVADWNFFGFRHRIAYRILNPNGDLNSNFRFPSQITMELELEKGNGIAQFSESHSEVTISDHTTKRERDLIILSNRLYNKIEQLSKQGPLTNDKERESLIVGYLASSIKKLNSDFKDAENYAKYAMPLAIDCVDKNDHNGLNDILNTSVERELLDSSQTVLAERQILTQRNQERVGMATQTLASRPATTILVGTANWMLNLGLNVQEVAALAQVMQSSIQIALNRIPFQEMVDESRIDGTFSLMNGLLNATLNPEVQESQLRHVVVDLYIHRVDLLEGSMLSNREIANSISDVIRGQLRHIAENNPVLEGYLQHRGEVITDITDSLTRGSPLPNLEYNFNKK